LINPIKTKMESNKTYWDSGLMAINTEHIREFKGKIIRIVHKENLDSEEYPRLSVIIRRDIDSLEGVINIYHNSEFELDEEEQDKKRTRKELLEQIDNLYKDFKVNCPEELINKPVTALYYNMNYKKGSIKPSDLDCIVGMKIRETF
jgi:hypothetical protein